MGEVAQGVREGVVDVEVPYDQEGEPKVGKEDFWRDRVDPVVDGVGGVGVNNPEGVETGANQSLI